MALTPRVGSTDHLTRNSSNAAMRAMAGAATLGRLPARQRGRPPPAEGPAGDPGQGDDHRERHTEQGQREERHHRDDDQGAAVEGAFGDADHRLRDDRQHGGRKPGEHRGDHRCGAEGDVDRRERQQRDHAGQHEQAAGDQPATDAVQQPTDVGGQLLGLRAGQQRAVVERVQEPALADPPLLVDQGALHDRDLAGRAADGLPADREPGPYRGAERNDGLLVRLGRRRLVRHRRRCVRRVRGRGRRRRRGLLLGRGLAGHGRPRERGSGR
jgi:hypothetical protein